MRYGVVVPRTFMLAAAIAAATLPGCGDGDAFLIPTECAIPLADSPRRGPADALVTIVEFADFECPYCGRVQTTLGAIDEHYDGEVRWVFKHLPLSIHPYAFDAAIAAECARNQGRFWEMARALFEQQSVLSSMLFADLAASLGLDLEAWQACRDQSAPEARIRADVDLAIEYGVQATPTFFVNGAPVVGAAPLSSFRVVVDKALASARKSGMGGAEYYASLVKRGCQ